MSSPISIADQIACVKRELVMRRRVYPGLVRKGTMTKAQMDYELACLQAVLVTLQPDTQPDMFATTTPEEHPHA